MITAQDVSTQLADGLLGDVATNVDTGGRRREPRVGDHPAGVSYLESRRAGERHLRPDAGPDHDRVGVELEPRLRHHLRHFAVRTLEAF